MRISENWSVSKEYLAELKGLKKVALMKVIEKNTFYGGYPLVYKQQEQKKIYDKIKGKR